MWCKGSKMYKGGLVLTLGLLLVGCEQQRAPDLVDSPWSAFRVDFCTETSGHEYWETRDEGKLTLLQGAFYMESPQPLERVVQSKNHRIFVVLNEGEAAATWQLTLKRDQENVTFFNTIDPSQSYQAETDAMFYRALNTLLESHMAMDVDIFRKCEIVE